MKNIFYHKNFLAIGGIETYLYSIALKYGQTHDITILYQTGDEAQLNRLKKLVRVKKWDGRSKYKCDKLFFSFQTDNVFDYVEAKDYYMLTHADYIALNVPMPRLPEKTHFLAVSELVAKHNKQKFGIDFEVSYNPIVVPEPRKVLRLISATRLTPEKGGAQMEILCRALEKADIPYMLDIFTKDEKKWRFKSQNVVVHPARLDITNYIAAADYLVQLSDTEGYGYSIIEALTLGTPVIIRDIPSKDDMKIEDRKNAFVLPYNMKTEKDVPVEEIYKGLPPFNYIPREDRYNELLAPGDSTYQEELASMVRVRVKKVYTDAELDRLMRIGDELEMMHDRAEFLVSKGAVEIL